MEGWYGAHLFATVGVMETRHIRIVGRVQGVFFRAFTKDAARNLGVVGTVKNLSDGSVGVVAQGETDILDDFVGMLRKGPPSARVERVEERSFEDEERFEQFTIIS